MLSSPAPKRNESIVSLHASQPLSAQLFRFYADQAEKWKSLIHISTDEREQNHIQSTDERVSDINAIVNRNSLLWLVYDSQQTEPESMPIFNSWFLQEYHRCGRAHNSFHIKVERFIRRAYPCELVDAEAALSVRYDNGIQLANRLYGVTQNELQVFLWWSDPRGGDHASSIQVFDSGGVKVAQDADRVIRYDPLEFRRIDISHLPPGHYSARLIVYQADSKQSQPGTVVQNQGSFNRELEIARFRVET